MLSICTFCLSISLPMSRAIVFRLPMMLPTAPRFSSISSSRASLVTLHHKRTTSFFQRLVSLVAEAGQNSLPGKELTSWCTGPRMTRRSLGQPGRCEHLKAALRPRLNHWIHFRCHFLQSPRCACIGSRVRWMKLWRENRVTVTVRQGSRTRRMLRAIKASAGV